MSNVSHAADWISERRADNVALAPHISEDWLSLIIGLLIFVLALAGLANVNLLGWVVTTSVWTNLGLALKTVSNSYGSLGGVGALITTYLALLVVLGAATLALKSALPSPASAQSPPATMLPQRGKLNSFPQRARRSVSIRPSLATSC
jgi:hypothetical protein